MNTFSQSTAPLNQRVTCATCRLTRVCWPNRISCEVAGKLLCVSHRDKPYPAGTQIFRQGSKLTSLYVVMVGSLKNVIAEADGTEQIVSFALPGDIVGLDALAQERYISTAETLESTVVCEFSYARLLDSTAHDPSLLSGFMQRLAGILAREHLLLLTIAQRGAEAKLASFLLRQSERMQSLGYSSTELRLSMTRRDVANYLALSSETVSRIFTRFQRARLATIANRLITIHDMDGLRQVMRVGETWIDARESELTIKPVEDTPNQLESITLPASGPLRRKAADANTTLPSS